MKFILPIFVLLISCTSIAQSLSDCQQCSQQKISTQDLKNKSADELRLLVNEIYARHGYLFKESRYQDHFESLNWYKAGIDNSAIQLNPIEKQNIAYLQQQISFLTADRSNLLQSLKKFKTAFLSANTYDLQQQFHFKYSGNEDQKNLTLVLKQLDLNDINWYKNKGIYEVVIDNGFVKITYAITIENQFVHLIYNYMEHSSIMEDFDVYTNYRSETEHYLEWKFEWYNNQLKYLRLNAAG
ncbi:YARHG domain-containing protein [Flavobacterium sp. HSC-61S13]|uniref:YARHG domain-containing protein n=1 Tax=Flavobacterium sp. HSC-61S13 TaxID=2910963 RepID=UPI00209F7792|nr:YARHG domain-containing protein [Flavobacterium sp. HSC-61S13]MCP1995881.1 hypothetical protein [Flavobacterium sp. HSC-61S13]